MPAETIIIREALPSDLPAILEIYNDAIFNTSSLYQYRPHTLEMRKAWFDKKQEEKFPVLVAESNNIVVGFGTYGPFRIFPGYRYTVEHSLYIHPEHRGKGAGKRMLQALVARAAHEEYHTLVAGIDAENEVSIKLHSDMGFKQTAYMPEVAFKFGRWRNLIFMQLILATPAHPTEPTSEP